MICIADTSTTWPHDNTGGRRSGLVRLCDTQRGARLRVASAATAGLPEAQPAVAPVGVSSERAERCSPAFDLLVYLVQHHGHLVEKARSSPPSGPTPSSKRPISRSDFYAAEGARRRDRRRLHDPDRADARLPVRRDREGQARVEDAPTPPALSQPSRSRRSPVKQCARAVDDIDQLVHRNACALDGDVAADADRLPRRPDAVRLELPQRMRR